MNVHDLSHFSLATGREIDPDFGDLLSQCIAVDPEYRGGANLIALSALQNDLEKGSFDAFLDAVVYVGEILSRLGGCRE